MKFDWFRPDSPSPSIAQSPTSTVSSSRSSTPSLTPWPFFTSFLNLCRPTKGVFPARINLAQSAEEHDGQISFIIGRGNSVQCYVFVQEHPSFLSRNHAKMIFREGQWYLQDLRSVNGTCVNMLRLSPHEDVALKPGDHVYFGNPHQSFFIEYEFVTLPLHSTPDWPCTSEVLNDLGDDLWSCQILSLMTLHELLDLRLVSKQWRARVDRCADIMKELRWDGSWPLGALNGLVERSKARKGMHAMRTLAIEGSFALNDLTIQPLMRMCGADLVHFDISGTPNLSHVGMQTVADTCISLEMLCVRGCKRVGFDWAWLMNIARNGTLVDVDVHGTGAGDEVVTRLAETSPRLRRLSCGVLLVGGVTDTSLLALARYCPELRTVDLRGCKGITNDGVAALVDGTLLETLILRSCSIGDAVLAFAGRNGKALTSLDLHRCGAVTDAGIERLVEGGLRIKRLDVSNILLTDRSLHALAKLECIEQLDLRSCRYISEQGLLSVIMANSRSLQRLDLDGCGGATIKVLQLVARTCQNLKELEVGGAEGETGMDEVRQLLAERGVRLYCAYG